MSSSPHLSFSHSLNMKESADRDAERLLPEDDLPTIEILTHRWPKSSWKWQEYWRENRLCASLVVILFVLNIILTTVIFYISTWQPYCPKPVNQPPQMVTPTLAHLVQKPKAKLLNITLFPDGSFFREHHSKEADRKWDEYDGSSQSASPVVNRRLI